MEIIFPRLQHNLILRRFMARLTGLANAEHEAEHLAFLGPVAPEQAIAVHVKETVANFHRRSGQPPLCIQPMQETADRAGRSPAAVETTKYISSFGLARKQIRLLDQRAFFQFAICGACLLTDGTES